LTIFVYDLLMGHSIHPIGWIANTAFIGGLGWVFWEYRRWFEAQ